MALTLLFPAIALAFLSIGLVDEALRMPPHVGIWSALWALCAAAGAIALGFIATGRPA
ncbi:hypothetical protein MKK84_24700 [Methylobacterium sp. E-065]|uniref:hypothetical protein n=1 Tax=Methylobacterium sp. E-065 TaxID=2836583 RepID=UPI001FB9A580|nr:hypothetical protein [Methylobacterium sp. E-065]MCJ2020589.1 hypothetical protein [Methylobacterium sp. E-065]